MPVYKNYLALIHGQRQCQLAVGTLQAYYKILMFIFNSLLHFFFSNSKKKNSIFRSRLKNGKMKKKKKNLYCNRCCTVCSSADGICNLTDNYQLQFLLSSIQHHQMLVSHVDPSTNTCPVTLVMLAAQLCELSTQVYEL